MKLGYAISAAPDGHPFGDLTEALEALARLGFDGVELSVRDPGRILIDALAKTAERLGIGVVALATGQAYAQERLSLTSPDDSLREGAVVRLLAQVEAAERLGALVSIGVIRGPIPLDERRGQAEERFIAGVRRVAQAARRRGVRIVIEPIHRYSANWLLTAREVMDLLARLGEDNVGVMLDTFHMNIEEADPAAALREARDRLWYFQVADNNRRAPGFGHLDFRACVSDLSALGYNGFVSAEVLPEPTLEAAARQTISVMRPLVPRGAR